THYRTAIVICDIVSDADRQELSAEQDAKRKKTRREVFFEEMDQVIHWAASEAVIEPFYLRV
ncbi:MAG: hypothetical protein ACO3P1_07085, partial [Pseudomonadales bacterium]